MRNFVQSIVKNTLASAVEDGEETVAGTQTAIQGWIDCFEKAKFAGTIFSGGVNDKGDIAGHHALETTYNTGRGIL